MFVSLSLNFERFLDKYTLDEFPISLTLLVTPAELEVYHLLNYGHGKKYLSNNMYLLTLLAFYFHQILELTDGAYQACRKKLVSKRFMWGTKEIDT